MSKSRKQDSRRANAGCRDKTSPAPEHDTTERIARRSRPSPRIVAACRRQAPIHSQRRRFVWHPTDACAGAHVSRVDLVCSRHRADARHLIENTKRSPTPARNNALLWAPAAWQIVAVKRPIQHQLSTKAADAN